MRGCAMYINTGNKQSIRKIENLGKNIILADNSKWEVTAFDNSKSMMWAVLDDVIVEGDNLGYKINHLKRNEKIEVKYLSE